MYIDRHISKILDELRQQFSAVLLTGARQVGKSTLLKHIAGEEYTYVSFDDPQIIRQVKEDPNLFLLDHPGKLILDEIQLAPEIFPFLKMRIDEAGEPGMFLLSGSQAFHLMQNVSESLAGRIAIVQLAGLSLRELANVPFSGPFVPSEENIRMRSKTDFSNDELWDFIFKGSYPQLHAGNVTRDAWYASYTSTYLERDVRQLINIQDINSLLMFSVICFS